MCHNPLNSTYITFMKVNFSTITLCFLILGSVAARADEHLSLDTFMKMAESQNLAIKSAGAAVMAADADQSRVGLPPPMVGLTQGTDANGSTNGFEISQSVPFPTRLTDSRKARKSMAGLSLAMKEVSRREILAAAKLLYFRLWQAKEKISLLKQKKAAVEEHLRLARASARSDSFLKIHLIKGESDNDLLDSDLIQADQDLREAQISGAELVSQDPESFIPEVDEPPLSEIPVNSRVESSPQVTVKRLSFEASQFREREAKATWFPEFNLRYREMGGSQMTPRSSEFMIGASLPFLFFWEPKGESGRAAGERLQSEIEFERVKLEVNAKRASFLTRAISLKRQLVQIREKLLPSAEKRMRLVHNLAPRDMETLQDHREAMEAFPDLKLRALDIRGAYEGAIAELEKIGSGDVP